MTRGQIRLVQTLSLSVQAVGVIGLIGVNALSLAMTTKLVVSVVASLLFVFGRSADARMKRNLASLVARHGWELKGEKHSPARGAVLYLRPFDVDGREEPIAYGRHQTVEESVLKALSRIGPSVALGVPNEEIPQAGAARVYYRHSEWKDSLEAMLDDCALCVLCAGTSSGVRWELGRCIARLPPSKLLIFVSGDEQRYRSAGAQLTGLIPSRLPTFSKDIAFVRFDTDWRPHVVRTSDAPFWARANRTTEGSARVYEAILGPVFSALSVPHQPVRGVSRGFMFSLKMIAVLAIILVILYVWRTPR